MLINSNMMLISDNLDNVEACHSLSKSKKENLNLNFVHNKYLISKIYWDYYNLMPLAVSVHTKLYELKNIKLEVINDK